MGKKTKTYIAWDGYISIENYAQIIHSFYSHYTSTYPNANHPNTTYPNTATTATATTTTNPTIKSLDLFVPLIKQVGKPNSYVVTLGSRANGRGAGGLNSFFSKNNRVHKFETNFFKLLLLTIDTLLGGILPENGVNTPALSQFITNFQQVFNELILGRLSPIGIQIFLNFTDNKKRDLDNIAKTLLDILQLPIPNPWLESSGGVKPIKVISTKKLIRVDFKTKYLTKSNSIVENKSSPALQIVCNDVKRLNLSLTQPIGDGGIKLIEDDGLLDYIYQAKMRTPNLLQFQRATPPNKIPALPCRTENITSFVLDYLIDVGKILLGKNNGVVYFHHPFTFIRIFYTSP